MPERGAPGAEVLRVRIRHTDSATSSDGVQLGFGLRGDAQAPIATLTVKGRADALSVRRIAAV